MIKYYYRETADLDTQHMAAFLVVIYFDDIVCSDLSRHGASKATCYYDARQYTRGEMIQSNDICLLKETVEWMVNNPAYKEISGRDAALILL